MTQFFSRMTAGTACNVILMSLMIATSFSAEAKFTRLDVRYRSDALFCRLASGLIRE